MLDRTVTALALGVALFVANAAIAQQQETVQEGAAVPEQQPAKAPAAPQKRTTAAVAPSGSPETGRTLFASVGCWQCHGTSGQGGGAAGPRIAPSGLPFGGFVQQLRKPVNQMIPYSAKILSDEQAADLFAFIQTQKREDPKQIPLLTP
jgi:mono/diheme cytochrome c family protein